MICSSVVNFGGIKEFKSAKTQKKYVSLVVFDEKNNTSEIGVPEEEMTSFIVQFSGFTRFQSVQIEFDLQTGQYTRLTLIKIQSVATATK